MRTIPIAILIDTPTIMSRKKKTNPDTKTMTSFFKSSIGLKPNVKHCLKILFLSRDSNAVIVAVRCSMIAASMKKSIAPHVGWVIISTARMPTAQTMHHTMSFQVNAMRLLSVMVFLVCTLHAIPLRKA